MASSGQNPFEPAVELGMLWKGDDAPLLEHVKDEFGEEIDEQLTEVKLRNFIHGYKHKGIDKIIERIRAKIDYQNEIGHKTIFEKEFTELPFIAQANPVCIFGQDKQGHPILYTRPCKANYEVCNQHPDLLKTYFIRTLEHLEAIKEKISNDIGYDIWRHTSIVDCKNLGLLDVKSIYTILKELAEISNYIYPESAHKVVIINAGWKFRLIKALFDYIIEESTAKKYQILGTDFYDTLIKEIDENQIPKEFGGSANKNWVNGGIILQNTQYPHTQI